MVGRPLLQFPRLLSLCSAVEFFWFRSVCRDRHLSGWAGDQEAGRCQDGGWEEGANAAVLRWGNRFG